MSNQQRAKSLVKRAARRFARPAFARLDELRQQVDHVQQQVDALEQRERELTAHLPTLLDAISTQNATSRRFARAEHDLREQLERIEESLGNGWTKLAEHDTNFLGIWSRMEVIRREILIEARYGPDHTSAEGTQLSRIGPAEPVILDKEKLEARPLRVNLGCGHLPLDGYVNVDGRDLPGVDVVAEIRNLPFEPNSVDEMFSSHMLEHLPEEDLRRRTLPYLVSLLAPNGLFRAVVPDSETMLAEHAAGNIDFATLREVMYGGQEYDGDFHFTMFSKESLAKLFTEAGLVDVEVVVEGRHNGDCYEMELCGRRRSESAW